MLRMSRVFVSCLLLGGVLGCRANEGTSMPVELATANSSVAPASGSGPGPLRAAPLPPPVPTPTAALPTLKPIQPKPFPEGVDEATVCEAIDSKEPDLWVRFGHLVPAYVTGAVYVLETGPETKDKLFKYIGRDYVYGYYSQQASCRGSLTLLYIRLMFDKSEYRGKPFGREHLSRELEKKFRIKTRESFQFKESHERLSDYCRQSAALCDQLAKVDRANKGTGLCGHALPSLGISSQDSDYQRYLGRCVSLPPERKVCTYEPLNDNFAARRCRCQLRLDLGIELDGDCERALGVSAVQ
jgi:hypothetical protein